MKKIIGFFCILLLAGAAFFFGWAQFPVPPGSYGVLRSKTHGVDPAVIREGEFRWIWYKLIPTNATTLVFALNPVSRPVQAEGVLPSGPTYAAIAGIGADFSYEITGTLEFTLKADALPGLALEKGVGDQAQLEEYETALAEKIAALAVQRLEAYAAEGKLQGGIVQTALSGPLEQDILGAFPEVGNLSLSIGKAKVPDLVLYTWTRSLYEEYLAAQRELIKPEIAAQAQRNINSLFRFDELAKYGELLTKYPALIQYLALPTP